MIGSVVILTLAGLFAEAPAQTPSLLTEQEASQILRALDDLCGDTWCEGDNNFSFDALSCDPEKGCSLDLTVKPYEYLGQVLPPHPYTCVFPALIERSAIARLDADPSGELRVSYAETLRDALSTCISEEIGKKLGPVLIPLTSGCHGVLLKKGYHSYSYYNVDAECYFEYEDKRMFAARVVKDLLESLASQSPSCQPQWRLVYLDAIECQRFEGSTTCHLPSDSGDLLLLKDFVDRAAVIFRPLRNDDRTPAFALTASSDDTLTLPDPSQCYDDLFVQSALSSGRYTEYPGPHGDHQTHYVRLPGTPNSDIRLWALRHVHALVKAKARARAGQGCAYRPMPFSLERAKCQLLAGIPVCSFGANSGGYYVVVFDALGAAQVIFNRWD